MTMAHGTIFDIKEMAVHDGPGLRTTVFFKGCPLRCCWCHNPEGLSPEPQLMHNDTRCLHCGRCLSPCEHEECQPFGHCLHVCPENCLTVSGRIVTSEKLAEELISSAEIMGDSFGGFTFSGGEPLYQPDFLLETAALLQDYHLCIETSGCTDSSTFLRILDVLDFVIMDIKLVDDALHRQYTGASNRVILSNFKLLQQSGIPHLIRTPLIPGITDTEENLSAISGLLGGAPWEKLPYNQMAGAKYKLLDMEYPLRNLTL